MPKCNVSKVALQLYWNCTSAWVFSCKFASYFQNTFSLEHLWTAASVMMIILWFGNSLINFFGWIIFKFLSIYPHARLKKFSYWKYKENTKKIVANLISLSYWIISLSCILQKQTISNYISIALKIFGKRLW